MMSDKDNGKPAFPITAGNQVYAQGMSLRDWLASQAPPQPEDWCAHPFLGDAPPGTIYPYSGPKVEFSELMRLDEEKKRERLLWLAKADATWRYQHADAMLAARGDA